VEHRSAIVFDAGDSAIEGLRQFAAREGVSAGAFTAIGACERVTLGYFDITRRDYDNIILDEQVEVLALTGNIAITDEGPKVHAHGGHLLDGQVRPTLEVIATALPVHLRRTFDPRTGLHLLNVDGKS
jgi:predicted DNA-binding protein with PD1-like motif